MVGIVPYWASSTRVLSKWLMMSCGCTALWIWTQIRHPTQKTGQLILEGPAATANLVGASLLGLGASKIVVFRLFSPTPKMARDRMVRNTNSFVGDVRLEEKSYISSHI